MAINVIVTNAGRAALVNAQNTGTDPVVITQMGFSETAVTPAKTDTALTGEFKRVSGVGGDVVAADTIHISGIDESADAYSLRSFALYLGDGTLFAIYGQAAAILEKAASAFVGLSIDIVFADIDTALLSFGDTDFLLPSATTTARGTIELATIPEAQAGIDALRALTPASAKAAILGWLLSQDGAGSGLDADLLDGQQGSYYSNIPARLGFTPVNKAGDTMAGPLTVPTEVVVSGPFPRFILSETQSGKLWYLISDNDYITFREDSGSGNVPFRIDAGAKPLVLTAAELLWDGARVWTAGNDGAGSGLDADLLDGQQGSYYRDLVNSTGVLPNSRFSGTYDGLTELGMQRIRLISTGDASLTSTVHGFQIGPTDGANIIADQNEIMARDGGAAASLMLNLEGGLVLTGPGGLRSQGDITAGGSVLIGSIPAWHAGNDGAGSGLDSDLLDGQQGSFYTNIIARLGFTPANFADFANSLSGNGYARFPNNLILQWGWADAFTNQQLNTVTFPIAFPNGVLRMFATLGTSLNATSANVGIGAQQISNSQGRIMISANSPGTTGAAWWAVGY